jgi:hypothetical protein
VPRPKRPWFRFYVEAVHDRKLRRLKPEYRWLFVACLAAARQSPEPGVLLVGEDDPMTLEDLSDFAGMSVKSVTTGMALLVRAGVLDIDIGVLNKKPTARDTYFVPAWNERQFESDDVAARTAKHRSKEQGRNVPTSFPGTAPETETETETDTTPQPPAERGAEVAAHQGQHTNCRACGTTRRALAPVYSHPHVPYPIPDADEWIAEQRDIPVSRPPEGWREQMRSAQ